MKISKLASGLFAAVGSALLVGSVVLCFVGLNQPSRGIQPPEEAAACADAVLEAVGSGDFDRAAKLLYGQPELDLEREPVTTEGKQLWNAYRDSIAVITDESCYGEGTNIYQTAQVTTMDITGTLAQLENRASGLLKQKLESAEDPAALLDGNGEVQKTLKDEIRTQALTQVLSDAKTVTTQITFQLIEKDGQWWALPDQALLDILSGGLG